MCSIRFAFGGIDAADTHWCLHDAGSFPQFVQLENPTYSSSWCEYASIKELECDVGDVPSGSESALSSASRFVLSALASEYDRKRVGSWGCHAVCLLAWWCLVVVGCRWWWLGPDLHHVLRPKKDDEANWRREG